MKPIEPIPALPLIGRFPFLRRTFFGILIVSLMLTAVGFAQTWRIGNSGLIGVNFSNSVAFGNGRFVATFSGASAITTVRVGWSVDGITWSPAASSQNLQPQGSVFFLDGLFYHVSSGGLFRSPDGDIWQAMPTNFALGGLYPYGVATDGHGFLTGTNNNFVHTLLYTSDLVNFRPAAALPNTEGLQSNANQPVYGHGLYLVPHTVYLANGSISPRLVSTPDALTWTTVSGISTVQSLAYGNGRFVLSAPGKTYLSTDGAAFHALTSEPFPFNTQSIRFAGGRFISSGQPRSSTDGVTWSLFGTLPSGGINLDFLALAYGNGRYVGVGVYFDGIGPRDFIASLESPAPPQFSTQPVDLMVAAGRPASLRVVAENPFSVTYQWFQNDLPVPGAIFPTYFISNVSTAHAGHYHCEIRNPIGAVSSDTVALTVRPAESAGRLINLSVRTFAGTGDRTFIAGFTFSGSGGKPVVVRGVGPGLASYGLPGLLADPVIELFSGLNLIQSNNDWSKDDGRSLGAFSLNAGSKDAVVRTSLSAGSYTVQLKGNSSTTGQALLEIYDGASGDGLTRLTNLSVRAQLEASQSIIAGFVIAGETPVSVVIRASGPALSAFALTGLLADPKLTLFREQTKLAENDSWTTDDGRELGAFPFASGSRDAALRISLPPGSYTVFAESSVPLDTGLVLVEVYEVP